MTEFHEEAPVSQYGAQRRANWLAGLQARADDMQAAAVEAHRADHNVITAGQAGIFGTATAYDMAAEVSERAARIGDGVSSGRELERAGGTYRWSDVSDSPAPPLVDLRPRRPGMRPTGASPLYQHMHGPK